METPDGVADTGALFQVDWGSAVWAAADGEGSVFGCHAAVGGDRGEEAEGYPNHNISTMLEHSNMRGGK